MNDPDFVEELATRLNLFLEADPDRAQGTLMTPMAHAGYANVGHFLGQLCCPRGITDQVTGDELAEVRFLMPVLDQGRIIKFRSVSGAELQEKAAEAARKHAEATEPQGPDDGSKIH